MERKEFNEIGNNAQAMLEFIKTGRTVPDENQLRMFDFQNADELLSAFVNMGNLLCANAQYKMLEHPKVADLLRIYGKRLLITVVRRVFLLPNASELILICIRSGKFLLADDQVKMLGFSNADVLAKEYITAGNSFCKEAQLKMLDLPTIVELLEMYSQNYQLCRSAEYKMLEHPEAKTLVAIYQKYQDLTYEAQWLKDHK